MLPTLRDGDLLLVRAARTARPDNLVVVDLPGDRPRSVKRLIRREPEGWWVERDNPHEGVDSWALGAVPTDDLQAVVVARLWPPRLSTQGRPRRRQSS